MQCGSEVREHVLTGMNSSLCQHVCVSGLMLFSVISTSRRHSDRLKTEGNSPAVLLKQPGTSDICINWKSETSIMCHCLIQSLRVQHIRQLHNMITLKHNVIFRVSNLVEKKPSTPHRQINDAKPYTAICIAKTCAYPCLQTVMQSVKCS